MLVIEPGRSYMRLTVLVPCETMLTVWGPTGFPSLSTVPDAAPASDIE